MLKSKNCPDLYKSICMVIVVSFAFLISLQKVYNYDIWWHLRLGEYFLDNLLLPTKDFLSFSTEGAPWVSFYWLGDPLFALIHKYLGMNGLLICKSLVIAIAALYLFLFVARGGVNSFWAALLVIAVLEISRFRFMLRPLFFEFAGIVFLLWFLYGMERFRYKGLLLFVVVLVWNGLHGSAFVAQVVMAFLVVEKLFERSFGLSRYQPRQLKIATGFFLLTLIALLLHPNGLELYKIVYSYLFSDIVQSSQVLVEEHKSLVLVENIPYLILVALAGLSFLVRRENFRLLSLLLYFSFAVLALSSMRYVALSAFVMAAIIGINFQGVTHWVLTLPGKTPLVRCASSVLLIALCSGLLFWTFRAARVYEFGLGVNQSRYPYAAVERLKEMNYSGNIYNSWRFGGFLQWAMPESKTFIDGRCLPEQLELYDRFSRISLHEFAHYMTVNNVQVALLDRKSQRDVNYFNEIPGFRAALMDDLSVLFVKAELLNAQGPASAGIYRYLRLGGYEYEYLAKLAQGTEAPLVESEIKSALQSSPENFFTNFLLAFFYDSKGDSRAAEQYVFAASKNPQFAYTHFEIGARAGRAALKSSNWSLAVQVATEALNYQKTGEFYFILGVAEHKLGRLDKAENAYRSSLERQDNPLVLSNLGFLLLEQGSYVAARDVFSRLRKEPDTHYEESALYGQALAHLELGEKPLASGIRHELLRKYPNSPYVEILRKKSGL